MIELKDGINFHNFLLDTKSREWFKRTKKESAGNARQKKMADSM